MQLHLNVLIKALIYPILNTGSRKNTDCTNKDGTISKIIVKISTENMQFSEVIS